MTDDDHYVAHVPGVQYGVLDQLTGYAVRRAQIRMYESFIAALEPWRITPPRFSALVIVSLNPGLKLTQYDLEMIQEVGYCNGIENYSMHIDGRQPGEPPFTLLDYFPEDYLLVIDESHVTVPQLHGQFAGDRSRKQTLIEHGFRLPSAADNRPLRFEEAMQRINQCIFLSATPADYELKNSQQVVEQIVRPTGLVDPEVIVKPTTGQIDDIIELVRERVEMEDRVLITTLTKKMAEDLSEYLLEQGLRVRYLHSNIDTIQRIEKIGRAHV